MKKKDKEKVIFADDLLDKETRAKHHETLAQAIIICERLTVGRIEKIAMDLFIQEGKFTAREVQAEIDNHGLLNINKWENKEAGFFDMKNYFKKLSQAIVKSITGGAK